MAEAVTSFVARRRPDWDRLQSLLSAFSARKLGAADVVALDGLFRDVASDLARAQALYPGAEVTRFLNQLSSLASVTIYRPVFNPVGSLRSFFAQTYPAAARAHLRFVAIAGALMAVGFLLGVLGIRLDEPGTAQLIPEVLKRLLAARQSWTDTALDGQTPFQLSAGIFTNNLKVIFATFTLGITGGIGTCAVLIINGFHLGAVLTLAFRNGMGGNLLDFIAAHGPMEFSIIALAAAAGLSIGDALLTARELPRAEVLRLRAKSAVHVVVGSAPILIGVGLIEGFVSPGQLFPTWLKAALGLALVFGFWWYLLRAGAQVPATSAGTPTRTDR